MVQVRSCILTSEKPDTESTTLEIELAKLSCTLDGNYGMCQTYLLFQPTYNIFCRLNIEWMLAVCFISGVKQGGEECEHLSSKFRSTLRSLLFTYCQKDVTSGYKKDTPQRYVPCGVSNIKDVYA